MSDKRKPRKKIRWHPNEFGQCWSVLLCSVVFALSFIGELTGQEFKSDHFVVDTTSSKEINSVGFEPDVIIFRITSTHGSFDTIQDESQGTTGGSTWGFGHGFVDCTGGSFEERALTVASGSNSTNGCRIESTDSYSILQIFTPDDGDGVQGKIRASVTATDTDGFTISVDEKYQDQYVVYEAYQFESGVNVDVGHFTTPTSTGKKSITGLGFEPNFLSVSLARQITSINSGVVDGSSADNGWSHGVAGQRGGTIEQATMGVSMTTSNVDDHVWHSSTSDVLGLLEDNDKGGVDGKVIGSLDSFDSDGFTVDFSNVNNGELAIYLAIGTNSEVEVGSEMTPTSTGIQTIDTSIQLDSLSIITNNTVDGEDVEKYSGNQNANNHHGWMFGGGDTSTENSIGYSSHSSSVNGHSAASSATEVYRLLYTDQDGNVLGQDRATIDSVDGSGFDLNWTSVATTSTDSNIAHDQVMFIYYGFQQIPDGFTWTGNDDGTSWNKEGNWDIGDGTPGNDGFPDDNGDVAVINSGSDNIDTPSSSLTVGEVWMGSSYTGTITLNDNMTIDDSGTKKGKLSVFNGTIDVNNRNLTVKDNVDIRGGTLATGEETITFGDASDDEVVVSAGELRVESDDPAADLVINAGTWTNSGGTVRYAASTDSGLQVLSGISPYYNLQIDASGMTYPLDGAISTDSNLTISNGTLDTNSSNSYSINVAGSWTNNGTFIANNSPVTFDATGGSPTITSGGSGFYDVTFDDAGNGVTWTLGDALDVDNSLTITSGTLDTDSSNNYSINVGGNWTNSGTFTANNSTVTFDATGGSPTITSGGSAFWNVTIGNKILGEAGTTTLSTTIDGGEEDTINFSNTYTDPVIVAFVMTRGGSQSYEVRVKDVTSTSCVIFSEEADDEGHNSEEVGYIVMEKGTWTLDDGTGTKVEANWVSTGSTHREGDSFGGSSVSFNQSFSSSPAVLHSLNTYNNGAFMTSVAHNVTSSGFDVQQEAGGSGASSTTERIGWIAIEPGITGSVNSLNFETGSVSDGSGDGVDDSEQTISYSQSFSSAPIVVVKGNTGNDTDGYWARGSGTRSSSDQGVYAEEDEFGDGERSHGDETFAYWAFESGGGTLRGATNITWTLGDALDVENNLTINGGTFETGEETLKLGDDDGSSDTRTVTVELGGRLRLNGSAGNRGLFTSKNTSSPSTRDRVAVIVQGKLDASNVNVRWLSASGVQFKDDAEIEEMSNVTFESAPDNGTYLNFDADNDQGDGDSIYDVKTSLTSDNGPAVFTNLEFRNTLGSSSVANVDANDDDNTTDSVKFQWWDGGSWNTLSENAVGFAPHYGDVSGADYEEDDGAAETGKVRWFSGAAVLEDTGGDIKRAFVSLQAAINEADDGDTDLEDNVVTQLGNVLFEPASDVDISSVDDVKISEVFLNAGITGGGSGSGNRLVNVVVKQDTSDGDTESIGQGTDVNEAFHCMVVDGDINADVAKNCVTVSTGNVTATTTGAANKSGVATSNFVDISNDDFHLIPSASTLIDQGVDISGTLNEDVDFDGNRRPIDDPDTSDNTSTWDIGPDEYGPYAKPETSLMIPSSGTSWSEIGPIEKNARGAAQCIYVPYVSGGTGFVKAYSVDIDGGNLGGNIGTQDGSSHVSGDTVERFVRLYVSRFWHNEWSNPGYRIYAIVDSADDGNTKGGKLYAMRHVDTTADGTKNVDTIVEDSNWGGTVSFSNASLANVDARMLSVTTNDQYIYVTDGYDGTVYRRNVSDGSAAGNDGSHTYDDEFYQLPQTWDDILLAGVEGEKAEVAQLAADLSSVNSTKDLGDGSHLNERLNFDKLSSGRSVYAAPDNPHIWRFASDTLNNEWTDGKSFDIGAPPRSYPGVFPGLEFVWGVARDRIYKVKKSDGSKPNDWGSGSSDWPLTFPNEVLNSSFSYWPFENLMFVSSRSGKAYYVNALLDDDGSGGTVTATGGADGSIVDGWPYIMPNKEITTSKMIWDGSWNFHVLYVYKDEKTGDFRLLGFPFP